MTKYLLILSLSFLSMQAVFAQENLTIAQLEEIVKLNRKDRDQVDVLNILCQRYATADPKKAERYGEEAERLADDLAYTEGLLQAYKNLASLYANQLQRHDKAVDLYEKAYLIYKQQYENDLISKEEIKEFMVGTVLKSSQTLEAKGDLRSRDRRALREYQQLQGDFAAYLAEFAQTTAKELRERETALDSTVKALETAEKELDQTETSLTAEIKKKNRQIYRASKTKESLSKENRALFDSLLLREFMQEDLEDSLMEREIRLKDARLKVLEQKSKVLAEQAKVNKLEREKSMQQLIITASVIGGLLVLTTAIVVFISLRKQRKLNAILVKQKQELAELNEEINQQNEEILAQQDSIVQQNLEISAQRDNIQQKNNQITASINYAERIQQAILPQPAKLNKHLQDAFVFFKPRDIVSGDFYWFNTVENKLIIAAVDCTGHGIPGAFMSMVGNTILSEIVEQRKITLPDVILNEMHRRIHASLRQDENKSRDGMDMALVTIDFKKQEMLFAGAKNPLIYIQQGKLHHIKGDKKPIGGQQKEQIRIFTRHTISLATPDNSPTYFYLFSDGYPDQFGGPEKRKFYTRNFRELLLNIHELSMDKQVEALSKTITDWMNAGNQKQLDDILVIGGKLEASSNQLAS